MMIAMKELKRLQQGWSEWNIAKKNATRSLKSGEGLKQFQTLYETLSPSINATEGLFRAQRETVMGELQKRLKQLFDWQKDQGAQSPSKHS